jgi:hypothetical protein
MRIQLLALGLLVAGLAGSAEGAGGPGRSPLSPGQVFATDLVELHDKGWSVADVAIEDHPETDGEETLTVVMAKRRVAERFRLRLGEWGQTVIGYERAAVDAPQERRTYRFETSLFEALSAGPVTAVEMECGTYYLQAGPSAVYLDESAYYVVTGTASGTEAQRQLPTILSQQLQAGDELVSVVEDEDEDQRTIDLTLVGTDTTVVRVFLDEHARVQGMEVRLSPGGYAGEVLRDGGELAKRLTRAQRLRTVSFDPETGQRVTFTVDKGRRIVVDTTNVDTRADEYEGCGC